MLRIFREALGPSVSLDSPPLHVTGWTWRSSRGYAELMRYISRGVVVYQIFLRYRLVHTQGTTF